jgi:replicative DNA helicase
MKIMSKNLQQKIENIFVNNPQMDDKEIVFQLKQLLYENDLQNYVENPPKNIAQLIAENIAQFCGETDRNDVIKTGFHDLDALIGGFRLSEFIVIGGRPGMGKTKLLVNLSLNISKTVPVLYVSYDLSELLLTANFISSVSEIPAYKILQRNLSDSQKEKLFTTGNEFANRKLFIHDSTNSSIAALKAHCQKQIQENDVHVIVVDYLQMMTSMKHKSNRELEISYICRELKNMAKEFNVCVIATSQLSREVEKRSISKCPQLADLRESGAIEQDADKVLFIYRPEYYGLIEDEEGNCAKNLVKIIVAKNRTGRLGYVNLTNDREFTNILNPKNEFSFFSSRLLELEEEPRCEILLSQEIPY